VRWVRVAPSPLETEKALALPNHKVCGVSREGLQGSSGSYFTGGETKAQKREGLA
jgi:hypothetical protein